MCAEVVDEINEGCVPGFAWCVSGLVEGRQREGRGGGGVIACSASSDTSAFRHNSRGQGNKCQSCNLACQSLYLSRVMYVLERGEKKTTERAGGWISGWVGREGGEGGWVGKGGGRRGPSLSLEARAMAAVREGVTNRKSSMKRMARDPGSEAPTSLDSPPPPVPPSLRPAAPPIQGVVLPAAPKEFDRQAIQKANDSIPICLRP